MEDFEKLVRALVHRVMMLQESIDSDNHTHGVVKILERNRLHENAKEELIQDFLTSKTIQNYKSKQS